MGSLVCGLSHSMGCGVPVPRPGIKSESPALQAVSQPLDHQGSPKNGCLSHDPFKHFFSLFFGGAWVEAVWRQSEEAYEPHLIIML